MTWWGWMIAGAILLGAELSFVNAQFYLVFIGGAAIVTGVVTAIAAPASWAQWALFAVLAIVSMLMFRSRVYQRFRGTLPTVDTGPPAGDALTVPVPLAAGESCQVEYRGSYWTARNDGTTAIPAGARARILRVQGLTLSVRPE